MSLALVIYRYSRYLMNSGWRFRLEVTILWTITSFGRYPFDDLIRISDIAGFAVYAVGKVDLKTSSMWGTFIFHDVVYLCWTKSLTGIAIFFTTLCDAMIWIGRGHNQVRWLVFVVCRARQIDIIEFVNDVFIVILKIFITTGTWE